MPDDNDLLLKELLAESRSIREKITDVQADMIRKDDFVRAHDKIEKRLDSIEDESAEQKITVADNSKFIGGMRWGLRVFAVAVLGVIVTGVSSFIHVDFHGSSAYATSVSSPSPTPTQMPIYIPSVQPSHSTYKN